MDRRAQNDSMFGLRLPELLVILVVFLVLFGSKKLPELGDSLGKGIRAFKKAVDHGLDESDAGTKEPGPQGQLPQRPATTQPTSTAAEKMPASSHETK